MHLRAEATAPSALEFVPPRCPNSRCRMHVAPLTGFYWRRGSYRPMCRPEPVPRFSCRFCGRGFSRQTFRLDRHDHRPECNERLFLLLTSGIGLRQSGRLLGLSVRGVQYKFRKLALGMRLLNRNLVRRLPAGGVRTFLLDEFETYEHSSILRVSVPVLIERKSLAILAVDVAPIRRVPRAGSARRKWLERHEAEHGRRRDLSRVSLRRVLGRFRRMLGGASAVLRTDEKVLYGALLRRQLGGQVGHETVSSEDPRTTYNPLFTINLTEAMSRDNNGRLRRRSWLVSKARHHLRSQLELFAAYRNWHRPRANDDARTPGMWLGMEARAIRPGELLAWRQDWRERSIHPTSANGEASIGRNRAVPDGAAEGPANAALPNGPR